MPRTPSPSRPARVEAGRADVSRADASRSDTSRSGNGAGRSGTPPSAEEIGGHRFARRRAAAALLRRVPVPRRDPWRTHARAGAVGVVLAVLAVGAGVAVRAVHHPADWRTADVVVGADSGALFVVAHQPDRLVPVPNLASARLLAAAGAAGSGNGNGAKVPTPPVEVPDGELADAARSRPVGIVDAPALPPAGAPVPPVWSVCDTGGTEAGTGWSRPRVRTTLVAAPAAPGRPLAPGEGLLLRDRAGATWLVHDGVRSRIDVGDPAVVTALHLQGQVPRPTTASLLRAVPEGPAVAPPALVGRGAPGPAGTGGQPVGAVLRLVTPGAPDRFAVIEAGGVQEVPPLVAELVHLGEAGRRAGPDPTGTDPIPTAAPGTVATAAPAGEIPLATYPVTAPTTVALPAAPTTCVSARAADPGAALTVSAVPPPAGAPLHQADGSGDRVDGAAVPGTGVLVRAVPAGRPDLPGDLAVVSGSGTVHAVPDPRTVDALGLGTGPRGPAPAAVPAPALGLLPSGPPLSPAALAPL